MYSLNVVDSRLCKWLITARFILVQDLSRNLRSWLNNQIRWTFVQKILGIVLMNGICTFSCTWII